MHLITIQHAFRLINWFFLCFVEFCFESSHKINLLTTMARLSYDSFKISMLATISTVFGCGVMPAGQRSTRSFTVSGFTLPVAMAYSTDVVVRHQVSGIAESQERARAIVERLYLKQSLILSRGKVVTRSYLMLQSLPYWTNSLLEPHTNHCYARKFSLV
ncbi:hypothetical protein KIN20_016486 [Parelaphostrongylus tenuis]|uniref:Uncharacterized protein n=1 Tax=Parelaphostrongylus tenuis TaxID=148309 RepID=A0AAD5N1F9_PARTN|nr:hypothetical protein KIN20_016486 [Parelaphostrongylus tenuis]